MTGHPEPKLTIENGNKVHYSAGAVIEKDGKYLLIDRAVFPPGFAGVAGHVDEGEAPEIALVREVEEEIGLKVTGYKLIFEEILDWNKCSRGIETHHWYVYRCETEGETNRNQRETKSSGWYTPEEMKSLKMEPVWEYWFRKLKVL